MIKRLIGRVLTPFSPKEHNFTVGYDKQSDQYFPRPRDLDNLDEYRLQKQACDRVNATMAAIKQIRLELPTHDGAAADRNSKEGEVAVTDLEIGGRKVDATLDGYRYRKSTLEVRLQDRALGNHLVAQETYEHDGGPYDSDMVDVRTDEFSYSLSRKMCRDQASLSYRP